MTKNIIIAVSALGSLFLYILFNTKETGFCNIYCGNLIGAFQNVFLFFPVILVFSLISYRFGDRSFELWWRFARISIPIIFLISIVISLGFHHTPGGFMNMSSALDLPALVFLYVVFGVGSLIQIHRGYKQGDQSSSKVS